MLKTAMFALILFLAGSVSAQEPVCPAGQVCIDQSTANKLFNTVEQLIAAKDVIAKMLAERGASDAAINSALKVIEGWKQLDAINNTIILKQKDVIALYERVMQMQMTIIENLEKRLLKPKSGFSKFLDALKAIGYVLAGVSLGRGL